MRAPVYAGDALVSILLPHHPAAAAGVATRELTPSGDEPSLLCCARRCRAAAIDAGDTRRRSDLLDGDVLTLRSDMLTFLTRCSSGSNGGSSFKLGWLGLCVRFLWA